MTNLRFSALNLKVVSRKYLSDGSLSLYINMLAQQLCVHGCMVLGRRPRIGLGKPFVGTLGTSTLFRLYQPSNVVHWFLNFLDGDHLYYNFHLKLALQFPECHQGHIWNVVELFWHIFMVEYNTTILYLRKLEYSAWINIPFTACHDIVGH